MDSNDTTAGKNDGRLLRRRFTFGVLTAAVVGCLLTLGLSSWISGQIGRDTGERLQILQLSMLADVIERAQLDEAQTGAAVAAFAERYPAFSSLRVLDMPRSLVASTAPDDQGELAAPRKLGRDNAGDKTIYDLGKELDQAISGNRADEGPRKEEISITALPDGRVRFGLPIEIGGDVKGVLEAYTIPSSTTATRLPGSSWLQLAFLLLMSAVFAYLIARRRLLAAPRLLAGLCSLVFAVAFLVGGTQVWRHLEAGWQADQDHFGEQVAEARTLAATMLPGPAVTPDEQLPVEATAATTGEPEAVTEEAPAPVAAPSFDATVWDVNRYRAGLGLITADGGAVKAAFVPVVARISTVFWRVLIALLLLCVGLVLWVGFGKAARLREILIRHRLAYAYVIPAMVGMLLLVFFPFLYGVAMSFTNQNLYNTDKSIVEISNVYDVEAPLLELWVGLDNYGTILSDFAVAVSPEGDEEEVAGATTAYNYNNFYWTFGFTVAWTVVNVSIGVSVGLLLALLLNTKELRFRPIYRVILILPWAVPNYITALIWRGMFHQQFGVINQLLQMAGAEPIAWFDGPFTSFCAVVATNGWLSFPFMMVISLGALQSISADLYEAAWVDGASWWQQFRNITLPSLKPALIPAIILSVVWTFNMFNIIYLVSAGQPAGATEILITDAYKIAFEQYRYGYAAAYSVVIFGILLVYGVFQNRMTQATEGI